MHYQQDITQLEVYAEIKKRRLFVGRLSYNKHTKRYTFCYDLDYLHSKSSIRLGPEFPLTQVEFQSEPNQLFPSLLDRIPDKENPAYPDYCAWMGISVDEDDYMVLLTTIGRRGPSKLIFEPVFKKIGSVSEELKAFRKALDLSYWDVAQVFDLPELTIMKIEQGRLKQKGLLRLLHYLLTQPDLALEQLERTGKRVHAATRTRIFKYFQAIKKTTKNPAN